MFKNKLSLEKSLYLQQHAENPIHWFPYGEEALQKAKELNRPIFLSIGYSSCHWCHVMAHESFEDENTASLLNDNYISIKVDREEFPDLDNYYQTACAIMTGRGGWPLSVFLTPEGKPFFAGTYFPKKGHQGTPAFTDVLMQITDTWAQNPDEVLKNAEGVAAEIVKPVTVQNRIDYNGHFPGPGAIMNALKNYADEKNGGYGEAPKFPHYPFFEWASEQILEGMIPKEQGQHIVESIEHMLMGGMYDHLKGGMHRYSTDAKFLVPHFEKMLYDQAGLLKVLAKVGQFYPSPLVFDGILQTLDYIKSEMMSDDNYFFTAQDADSEGTEGLYFTFSKEEFEASFEEAPPEQKIKLDYFLDVFNITEKGNFEHGLNVISLNPKLREKFYTQDGWQEIREVRHRLLQQRKMRIPPATDRKGIAGWNYMLISALCDLVQYCPVDVIQAQAFELIKDSMEGCMKQFMKTDRDGKHVIKHVTTIDDQALYLEDYVNFSDAQLRLYEVTGNETFKTNAIDSTDFIINNFIRDGKLFQTAINASTRGIENLAAPLFDQSYKSSATAFVLHLSRLSVFRPEFSPEVIFKEEYKEMPQFILTNPLGHGEGLRAFTYPLPIFRKIEVPMEWLQKPEFLEVRSHFFSRFVMDYHNRKDDSFQICNATSCELTGKGIEEFQKVFTGKEEDAQGN